MAGATIPLIVGAVSAVGPQIPAIVRAVEALFGGHSKDHGSAQTGPSKMDAAVEILTTALASLANAGLVPSSVVLAPGVKAALAGAVQQTVDQLKGSGELGPAKAGSPGSFKVSGVLSIG